MWPGKALTLSLQWLLQMKKSLLLRAGKETKIVCRE
jgi:hypothetical protein